MTAITARCYGTADVLKLETLPRPTPADDEVLVRVHAASLNPLDWHYLHGTPYLVRFDSGFGRRDSAARFRLRCGRLRRRLLGGGFGGLWRGCGRGRRGRLSPSRRSKA